MTRTTSFLPRRIRRAALASVGVLAVGGLGLAAAPTAGAVTTTRQCSTADLAVSLKPGSPGAGQRYATVVLTNTSGSACTVHGYGGLALLGAPRQGVPTDLRRVASPAPATVTVRAGGSARSLLHWTVVPAADENGTACEPTAVTVVVTPPNQTTSALRPWTFGPVCQHGAIQQNAYVAGSAAF
ncbi:MAG TPA: DUF4232 domain-containing protein [Blastococcus sp.]|jgi:hypothetical protein|nr:DUF4232 domain-containing protein [Blastococcus sp.]